MPISNSAIFGHERHCTREMTVPWTSGMNCQNHQWDELLKIQLFMDYIIITSHSSELNISCLCNSTIVSCAHPGYNVYTNEDWLHILHKLLPINHTDMASYCKQHFHTCRITRDLGLWNCLPQLNALRWWVNLAQHAQNIMTFIPLCTLACDNKST